MRDEVVTDEDLRLQTAKQQLESIAKRPGYHEAMKVTRATWTASIVIAFVTVGLVALTYACHAMIDTAWLRWLLVVFFGVLSVSSALLILGASPHLDKHWLFGVAVVGMKADPTKSLEVELLEADGTRITCPTDDDTDKLLRIGDLGVAKITEREPHELVQFSRL